MAAITTPADTNCAGSPCAATDHAVCCTASAGYNIPADGTAVLNVCTAKADAAAWTALGCTTTTATATGVAGLGTVTAATGYTSCAITCPTNAAAFIVVAVKKPAVEPEPEPATPSAGPDEVVVLTQTLAMTGVTAAEVCTDEGKKLILEAVAEALKVKVEQLLVTKCADTTGRRRSLLAAGVDLEYQVTLDPAEAKEKQAEIVKTMTTLEGESEATKSVLAAVAKATGKDVSTLTVKGTKTVVTINKAELVVSAANTASIGVVSIIVATIAAATGL